MTLDIFDTSSLERLSMWIFWIYMLAAVGVIAAIGLESHKFSAATQHKGWFLVIVFLAAENALYMASHTVDEEISSRQKSEIVTLQKRLLPRRLTSEHSESIANAIASAPIGTKFEFSATTEEAANLAQSLATIFEKAGWQWIDWRAAPGDVTTWLPANNRRVGWVMLSGIEVSFSNPNLFLQGTRLIAALKAANLEGVRRDATEGPLENRNAPMVMRIMIGERPALYLDR